MLIRAEAEGEKLKMTHVEDLSPVWKENYELRKDPNKGFSKDRSYQRIMQIPNLLFLEYSKKYPELVMGTPEDTDRICRIIAKEHPETICAGGKVF